MEEEFLLKQLVACAIINRKGEDANQSQEDGEDGDEYDANEDDWDVKEGLTSQQRRRRGESGKSVKISEIDKSRDAQFEGGEND